MVKHSSQPWLQSSKADLLFILGPSFLSVFWVLIHHLIWPESSRVSPLAWLILVVGVDVAHVYSTLYRTYFASHEFKNRAALYILTPLVGWLIGVVFYAQGTLFFWRSLAYLAVFHFVRQQYGFMRIYSRRENSNAVSGILDQAVIYLATLYPLIYWHTHLPRSFHWFVDDDFVSGLSPSVSVITGWLYLAAIIGYVADQAKAWIIHSQFNLPKNLLVLGTALSWYIGIITLNGDLEFTATNVISHGVPYMALIWILGRKEKRVLSHSNKGFGIYALAALPLFLGILVTLAYLEEGVWDGLIWRDHENIFPFFSTLPIVSSKALLTGLVPFLALPQITHYLLDGFIWKQKGLHAQWKRSLS